MSTGLTELTVLHIPIYKKKIKAKGQTKAKAGMQEIYKMTWGIVKPWRG